MHICNITLVEILVWLMVIEMQDTLPKFEPNQTLSASNPILITLKILETRLRNIKLFFTLEHDYVYVHRLP